MYVVLRQVRGDAVGAAADIKFVGLLVGLHCCFVEANPGVGW
jgi:hypothetical protein